MGQWMCLIMKTMIGVIAFDKQDCTLLSLSI